MSSVLYLSWYITTQLCFIQHCFTSLSFGISSPSFLFLCEPGKIISQMLWTILFMSSILYLPCSTTTLHPVIQYCSVPPSFVLLGLLCLGFCEQCNILGLDASTCLLFYIRHPIPNSASIIQYCLDLSSLLLLSFLFLVFCVPLLLTWATRFFSTALCSSWITTTLLCII